MCCGNKRLALRNATPVKPSLNAPRVSQRVANTRVPQAPRPEPSRTTMPPETSRVLVRGPVTGRLYDFSGGQPSQAMDPRDGAALMRSGFRARNAS